MPTVFFKPSWVVKLKGLSSQLGVGHVELTSHSAAYSLSFRASPEMDSWALIHFIHGSIPYVKKKKSPQSNAMRQHSWKFIYDKIRFMRR